ncbi:MAG: hypothetical protein ABIW48_07675 [Burkholderiales bacterium]
MKKNPNNISLPSLRIFRVLLALLLAAVGSGVQAQDANSLRARHAALKDRLANNQFQRPLFLESAQSASDLRGDVFAVVEHPFSTVKKALQSVDHWCDILILHLNIKRCRAIRSPGTSRLSLALGKKYDQPPEDAFKLEFAYRVAVAAADYLQVRISADEGPLGTRNYRLHLQAVPVDARHSFIHMSYSYGYGLAARVAMKAYLGTIGREKVGFSIVNRLPDGRPVYIRNVLGLVERNAMRYYLAIDAYLGAYALPATEQVERRLQTWYASTERYATQLHEMQRSEYLEMKRKEIRRQRAE